MAEISSESAPEARVGQAGKQIETVVMSNENPMALAECTRKDLVFTRPDRTKVTKPAVFATDGLDGALQYVTEPGFLDQPGAWQVQAHVQFNGGLMRVYALPRSFMVGP